MLPQSVRNFLQHVSLFHQKQEVSTQSDLLTLDPLVATASDVQQKLEAGEVTSVQLVELYLDEISKGDDYLRVVTSMPPRDWILAQARGLDKERQEGRLRGPLHGIPILIKDLIDTEPGMGMSTTLGSLALAGTHSQHNAKIVDMLFESGAIILAKVSLSEWGWFRGNCIPSGWCAITGQGQSPYVLGGVRSDDSPSGHSNPAGSSSGSAIGVAAGFAPISIGSESTGSLMMPACRAALYAIKPTIGLVSGDGTLSVSKHHDTFGPMAKSALDIANLLDVISDTGKVPDSGFTAALTGRWDKIRVGVLDPAKWTLGLPIVKPVKEIDSQLTVGWAEAYNLLEENASSFRRIEIISIDEATANGTRNILDLAKQDFKSLLKEYLAVIPDATVHDLADIIKFNEDHADKELPPYAPNQDNFYAVQAYNISDEDYNSILEFGRRKARTEGIDKAMREYNVNIIVAPSDSSLFIMSSLSGYPIAAVPYKNVDFEGNRRPYGLFALASAHDDALLVEFMSAWESVAPARMPPSKSVFN